MFFETQDETYKNKYIKLLKIIVSLSRLNSDKDEPYLYYRMAENIFCESFKADNLARNDISIDAKKGDVGLGLKTFSHKNGKVLEKIAEFNKDLEKYKNENNEKKCEIIADLRNQRLDFASKTSDTNDLIYHCISREKNLLYIHEEPMIKIDIKRLKITKTRQSTLFFTDGLDEYSFNISKSTLFKRFNINPIYKIPITILQNPYQILEELWDKHVDEVFANPIVDSVVLPLYSTKGKKLVPEKSGLNQWNAGGRARNPNEIYIPIPKKAREIKPNFFPSRDNSFSLRLPNGSYLNVKVCQQGDKALMSYPNLALGEWLLRDVLKLQEGVIVTYDYLKILGVDSVEIVKYFDGTYAINFKKIGSYEEFLEQNS